MTEVGFFINQFQLNVLENQHNMIKHECQSVKFADEIHDYQYTKHIWFATTSFNN